MTPNGILWLSHLFFPRECAHCGVLLDFRNREYLCPLCRGLLAPVESPVCPLCGQPLEGRGDYPVTCPVCRKNPPAFRQARSAVLFSAAGRSLVSAFKYSAHPYLSGSVGRLLAAGARRWFGEVLYDLIVPVPLHPRKRRERGFDQAAVLARDLSRKIGVPLDSKSLKRVRYTPSQTRLSRKERRENIRHAFRVAGGDRFRGKTLLLVDDVYTTGATVNECATALRGAGAADVDVLTVARAVER